MITAQTIRKLTFFIAVASFFFTLITAFLKYLQLDLTTIGAPPSFYLYSVLIEVIPYIFVGVISLLISILLHDQEQAQKQPLITPEMPQAA
ncbi:hypothetical protein GX563_11790 [Candidatus Bathyarchaeota archaeon]|nr:hypothetical protein [Candidatus Bathyarchaeota archaeon]